MTKERGVLNSAVLIEFVRQALSNTVECRGERHVEGIFILNGGELLVNYTEESLVFQHQIVLEFKFKVISQMASFVS